MKGSKQSGEDAGNGSESRHVESCCIVLGVEQVEVDILSEAHIRCLCILLSHLDLHLVLDIVESDVAQLSTVGLKRDGQFSLELARKFDTGDSRSSKSPRFCAKCTSSSRLSFM